MFTKRLGLSPQDLNFCAHGCPDILEMENGDFAVIGTDITGEASGQLPAGSGCAPAERIIRIPRQLLIRARRDIPTA
jgi:hypothetical protein